MVLDGRSIVEKRFVQLGDSELLDIEEQVQPNGVDLRLNKIYSVQGQIQVPHKGKVKHDLNVQEVRPKENWYQLKPAAGVLFYIDFVEEVNVPAGWCATLITRSSLVRSGVDVMSGLWDSGFTGTLGACLRLQTAVDIEWGARICQILFHEAKFNGQLYDGRYQGTNSTTAMQ